MGKNSTRQTVDHGLYTYILFSEFCVVLVHRLSLCCSIALIGICSSVAGVECCCAILYLLLMASEVTLVLSRSLLADQRAFTNLFHLGELA